MFIALIGTKTGLQWVIELSILFIGFDYFNLFFEKKAIPYLTPINQSFQLSGIYLIIAVSIDRYILLKNNLVHYTQTNKKRRHLITWLIILIIFTGSFLFTLPNWFVYTSKHVYSNLTKSILFNNKVNLESL